MQGISSCISCINPIKYNIVSKTGVKEFSLSNPSSFHGIPLPRNSWFDFMVFATSRHAILGIVHIDDDNFFLSKQALALFCSKYLWYMKTSFKLWWFSTVLYCLIFPMPIHMLHSDFGCENYTTSKMTIFTKFLHFYTQLYSGMMPLEVTMILQNVLINQIVRCIIIHMN